MVPSFPYLAFDQRFFIKNLSDIEKRKPDIEGKVEKFEKYVHGSVLKFCKHNITMRRFCLFMCLINFRYISDLDHWIWLAITNNYRAGSSLSNQTWLLGVPFRCFYFSGRVTDCFKVKRLLVEFE